MKLSPPLRARITAAQQDVAVQSGASTFGWSDDQTLSALAMITGGHRVQDAVAIVRGDAVLEDGQVDYNPGCAWIDFALAKRNRTAAEAERIVSEWETKRFDQHDGGESPILEVSRASGRTTHRSQTGHLLL